MKLTTAIVSLIVVSMATAGLAQGKMPAKAMTGMKAVPVRNMSKADWQKMYNEAEKCFANKDVASLTKYMTPDFTMTTGGKTKDLAGSKQGLTQFFGMMKTLRATMTVTKVSQKGDMAMVTDSYRMSGNMMSMNPKVKKTSKMVDTGTETATWVKVKGKWMMKKLVSTDDKVTIDGKVVDPNKMGG
jgi:ketosteroid isomerase-like protein